MCVWVTGCKADMCVCVCVSVCVCRLRVEIESAVGQIIVSNGLLRRDPDESEKQRHRKRAADQRAIAESKGEQLNLWLRLGGDTTSPRFTDAALNSMLRGEVGPWLSTSLGPAAASMYHGQRLFMAKHDLDRCIEELKSLPIQVKRVRAYLGFMRTSIAEQLNATPALRASAVCKAYTRACVFMNRLSVCHAPESQSE